MIRFGIVKLKNCVFRFSLRSPFTYFVLRTEYRIRLGRLRPNRKGRKRRQTTSNYFSSFVLLSTFAIFG